MDDVDRFIDGLPKAELHVHIEGTLEPQMMLEMAARNGVELSYANAEEVRAAYRFGHLQDFLDLYYQGLEVLRSERDFYDLTCAYLEKARSENVLYAEIFFDPQAHTRRGVPFDAVVGGIRRAVADVAPQIDIHAQLILCFLRDLDAADAQATLTQALPYRDSIVAVGLDSAEREHPPEKFRDVFERARDESFLTVAHAGEEGPAEYVWQALELLGVSRIDHGNHCLDDERLVRRLAADQIPLTVCPLSNLRLGVVRDLATHPLGTMIESGLKVTVNSDDPAYFGGYINENYRAITRALALHREDIVQLARNSFTASFLGRNQVNGFLARIDDYVAAH